MIGRNALRQSSGNELASERYRGRKIAAAPDRPVQLHMAPRKPLGVW